MKTVKMILMLVGMLFVAGAALAGPDIRYGLWETKVKMEMTGMPMEMPPVTFTQCITEQNSVPQQQDPNQDCQVTNNQIKGSTVSWDMQCSGRGAMQGSGRITYEGDSFNGSFRAVTGGMEMTQHMSGRRIGDCE